MVDAFHFTIHKEQITWSTEIIIVGCNKFDITLEGKLFYLT